MMKRPMIRKVTLFATLLAAALLAGCGTSSEGSRYQDQHGVAQDSGYPHGQPRDAASPALGSVHEPEETKEGPKTDNPAAEKPKDEVKKKHAE